MTEQRKVKSSTLRRGVTAMIVLAAVFALLIVGYFAILRPYLNKKNSSDTEPVEMIWGHEVASIDNRMLVYEHITRDEISRIEIHNPSNQKYGEQYVNWGIYRYTGENNESTGMQKNALYLIGYEYAPYDETALSYLISAAGFTLASSRVEDHCSDFSKYGLDFQNEEDALSVTITTLDGRSYTYYVGDQLPSGSGYYVRCVNTDKLLSTGEEMQRDSVYVMPAASLTLSVLSTPQKMVDPYLTLPVSSSSTSATLDDFAIWRQEDQYLEPKLDEKGNQVYDESGKPVIRWNPMIRLRPLNDLKDPSTAFSGLSLYYAVVPDGYYGSTSVESLFSTFSEFKGNEVMELGQTMVDEDGEEYIGFTPEIMEKYDLTDYYYQLYYEYSGVDNYVYFSKKQADGSYYAYSLNFNIICRVTEETVYFLNWTPESFLQRQPINLNIDACDIISVEGSYYDLGVLNPDRKGEIKVNERFELTNTGNDLKITAADGSVIDTKNFRQFYKQLLQANIREQVSAEDIAAAMENEPMATISVKTRRTTVYKTDAQGNYTSTVDYVRDSATKVVRYYKLTNGRVLCTTQMISADGSAKAETGAFYILTSRVEELLSSVVDLREGITIDATQRH